MAKRDLNKMNQPAVEEQTISQGEVRTINSTELALVVPQKLTPASVVGTNTKLTIPQSMLPEEFQGQQLEVLETGFAPTVKWVNPGEMVAGVFEGVEDEVGPNKASLYQFDAKGKKFGVWGTTVLDRTFDIALKSGQLKPGYLVCIIYLGGIPTDFQDAKMFNIQVVKKG